ncbi:MAG: hypothetical protein WEB03_11095 [Nitriliruptor sp.]|uniref:hypothetical protein n=1 Tax=Nitriliruptor sp. TaxID=2448056 RepID=UPI00349FD92A
MEERTPHPPGTSDNAPTIAASAAPPAAGTGAQVPLPFDDEAEHPIPFALTARARRTVAPHALPTLRVVPGSTDALREDGSHGGEGAIAVDEDPSDTRPARARALRRAGVDRTDIATQLGVDELLVRAWTGGVVAPRHAARSAATVTLQPVPERDRAEEQTAADRRRQRAADDARDRLRSDPHLAAGLGVLAGVAEIAGGAVTVTTRDPRLARTVVRWLVDVLGADPRSVRLVLRVGPRAAGDLARHRWGQALALAPERIRTTRAGAPPEDDAVEGVLRIVDADLAATAAGWCDALLDDALVADPAF